MTEILCCKALKKLEGSTTDVDLVNWTRYQQEISQKVTSQEILKLIVTIVKVL